MKDRRQLFLAILGSGILVLFALAIGGKLPFLPERLLALIQKENSTAAAYFFNYTGGAYAPYPGQTSCDNFSGDSCGNYNNCQGNPIYGAVDIQNNAGTTGSVQYVYSNGGIGSGGTAPSLASRTDTVTLDYACTPSRYINGEHEECHYQLCGKISCRTCGCYGGPDSSQTFNTAATVQDPSGATIISDSGGLYGSSSLSPAAAAPAGTYASGQTLSYKLYCNGVGVPAVGTVTIGSTSASPTLTAKSNNDATGGKVRQGLDQATLTVGATGSDGGCQLLGPSGVMKTYPGPTVSDSVTVGPLQATSTYTLSCTGVEGFRKDVTAEVDVIPAPALSITANNTPYQISIPPSTSADIRWTSSIITPNTCSVTYSASGGSCAAAAKPLATKGAYNFKSFTIGTDTYLAVANAYNGSSYQQNSNIYKWMSGSACFGDGTTCGTAYQAIPTTGAATWESFVIGADTYLAVANSRDDTTRAVNSNIYKWMSGSACFGDGTTCGTPLQGIATTGAVDLHPVLVGSTMYLMAANYRDDSGYKINSNVYRWMSGSSCFGDGTTCGKVLQALPTIGAYREESFSIGTQPYLVMTNATDGSNYNQQTYIYKFNNTGTNCPAGGGWGNGNTHQCGVPFQTLSTSGAYGAKYFMIGNVSYLAVANAYDGSSFSINSKIYQWIPTLGCFGDGTTCGNAFQAIATNGATELNTFNIGSVTYLVAANAFNGNSYNVNSGIYVWMSGNQCFGNEASCGVPLQTVPTSGASWWEPMLIGGNTYLALANYFNGSTFNINSSVMQWSPNGCGGADATGTPTVWTSDQSPPPNGYPTGLFTGARLYTLTCKWIDNSTASSTSVNVVVLPELILSANGSSSPTVYITPSTSALIQWSAKNVQQNSCSVSNDQDTTVWSADTNTAGYSSPVLAEGNSITYTLACTDLLGNPTSQAMKVTAAAIIPSSGDLSLSASRVIKGTRPTLTWNAQNLRSGVACSITPTLAGGASASNWDGTGTSWTSPPGGALGPAISTATAFTLACTNKAGDRVFVTAIAALIPAFKEI